MLLLGAENDVSLFLGDDLITYLLLAFGGALFVGNIAAILRPPERRGAAARPGRPARGGAGTGAKGTPKGRAGADRDGDRLERAPVGRSLVMAGIGLVAAAWALVSLIRG